MNKIKLINPNNVSDFFEIPWEWISVDGLEPNLEDLEASANRGKLTGYLYRKRAAEVPNYVIQILKELKQVELYPLLKIIRKEAINVYYFDPYENGYVTREFYVPKPTLIQRRIPISNDTDNIIYAPFEIELIGYGGA